MTDIVLDISGLTKRVKQNKKIVDNVSFQMKKGEILGLLGPNGAGKTTTIRMIVGLIKKTEGSVKINGLDLDEEGQACKSEVGAIVENPAFYDYMSGYKNLQQYGRMSKKEIPPERYEEVIELVKLKHAINDKVKKYSLGMKQRLGVAQALLHHPAVLILDEPTNGLDPKGIRELRDYLRQLANEGISTLVSSHLLSEMQLMCDRVVIMEQGKIINVTTIESLDESNETEDQVVALRLNASQVNEANDLLNTMDTVTVMEKENSHILVVKTSYDNIPALNKKLVEAAIDIYAIELRKTSLEDKFLALTADGEAKLQKEVE
ncbi:ABC transporter ATP-binding protein [Salipaludibacillus sp. LMS25]|uniref:ABC transporter ATP-binding protein n=1 Tax=Salipaludibacillus sp. LMS25 TaxID=2924031 RepID=UPI0020D01810|nr:ABC transporter ATP-binding protein [Salipaludibacillus sp. LMS25]UTR13732.1 ABC transporter ATP-binding protein [Salipaludibacillus sp. LMS25]